MEQKSAIQNSAVWTILYILSLNEHGNMRVKVYKNGSKNNVYRSGENKFSLLEVIISHKDIINFLNKHITSLKKDVGMNASTAPK